MSQITFLKESQVKGLLSWSEVYEAVEMALRSVVADNNPAEPTSSQPARSFTSGANNSGVLLSMPGFIGNYRLPSVTRDTVLHSLGCKLVTSYENNNQLVPPLPKILATIVLMNPHTGQLEAIVEGTEITTMRTAVASLVSTQTLYFDRAAVKLSPNDKVLSIIGCGVQGESHAMGFAMLFGQFKEIRLWNRSPERRDKLYDILTGSKDKFKNTSMRITKCASVKECLAPADVIVTATNSQDALIQLEDVKSEVHINAIGFGRNHHAEVSEDIYNIAKIYVDNWQASKTELTALMDRISGTVGDVLRGIKEQPNTGITVFQSMGMAVEDVATAQLVLEKYKKSLEQ